jgi:hypothetical protein
MKRTRFPIWITVCIAILLVFVGISSASWIEIDDETGETDIRIIGKATEAAIRLSTIDLTAYSSKNYRIVLHDGTYDVWGWIGEADAAEALGAELITNGDMELDSTWEPWGTPTEGQSAEQKHGGAASWKVIADAAGEGIYGNVFTTVTGKLYKVDTWQYPADEPFKRMELRKGDLSGYNLQISAAATQGAWNQYTRYYTELAGGAQGLLVWKVGNGKTGYLDDVTIKNVTALGLDAVHIYTTRDLTVQSWNGDTSDFDFNNVTALEVEKYSVGVRPRPGVKKWHH